MVWKFEVDLSSLKFRYDILNYQYTIDEHGEATFGYVQIGEWKNGRLFKFNKDLIQWANWSINETRHLPIKSTCSEPCGALEEKVRSLFVQTNH